MTVSTARPSSPRIGLPRSLWPVLGITAAESAGRSLWRGFHPSESSAGMTFRWSEPVATIALEVPPDDYVLHLDTGALRGCAGRIPFQLYWNDERIDPADIVASGRDIFCRVRRDRCLDGTAQRLLLVVQPLVAAPPDTRELGLPLVAIEVYKGDLPALVGSGPKATRHLFRRRKNGWQGPVPHLPRWVLDGLRAAQPRAAASIEAAAGQPADPSVPRGMAFDSAIVCADEINGRHGTGLLLQYMFPDLRRMAVLETASSYGGEHVPTGVTRKLPTGLGRAEVYRCVFEWLGHAPPSRAYVVPFHATDLQMALALRHLFGTRLALHVMDDNTLVGNGIPASLMEEAIANTDVRFAISPQMQAAYEQRFGRKFHLLPPVVQEDLVALPFEPPAASARRGAIIGNAWGADWIDHLVEAVGGSGVQLDWFCNSPASPSIAANRERLAAAGIFMREPLWGDALVRELRKRPFIVVPTGLPSDHAARAIAQLSLPSRAVFHLAAVRTPILVLGDPATAVGDFVRRFELGAVAPYQPQAVRDAVASLRSPEAVARIRRACDELAPRFTATAIDAWIWRSLELGRPADERFDSLWPPEDRLADHVSPDPPRGMYWAWHAAWRVLARYARAGGRPRTILDVGASTGLWSHIAASVFPDGHFVLCEPLHSHYPAEARRPYVDSLPSHDIVEKVVTDHSGQTTLLVSDSLYGSSLLSVDGVHGTTKRVPVECTTIDALDEVRHWDGPILLKADVQGAEHLVLEGAAETLRTKVDAVFLELSLSRSHADSRTYAEMCSLMDSLGFELFDEAEGWRDPRTARLEQKDVLFVRRR